MNLNHLKLFHYVAKYKSYTKAAEKLFLTQPGISKQIKDLENYYSTKLFDRSGKRIQLTQAGEIVFELTQSFFDNLEIINQRINDLNSGKSGNIIIHSGHTPGIHILPEAILKFKKKFKDINIHYDISTSKTVKKKLLDNSIDIGITAIELSEKFISIPFLYDELVLVMPNNHQLSKIKNIKITDLKNQKLLHTKKGSPTRSIVDNLNSKFDLCLNIVEIGNPFAIVKSIEAGNGITIMSKIAITKEADQNNVTVKKINDCNLKRAFYLNYRKDKYVFKAMETFILFFLKLHDKTHPFLE